MIILLHQYPLSAPERQHSYESCVVALHGRSVYRRQLEKIIAIREKYGGSISPDQAPPQDYEAAIGLMELQLQAFRMGHGRRERALRGSEIREWMGCGVEQF